MEFPVFTVIEPYHCGLSLFCFVFLFLNLDLRPNGVWILQKNPKNNIPPPFIVISMNHQHTSSKSLSFHGKWQSASSWLLKFSKNYDKWENVNNKHKHKLSEL